MTRRFAALLATVALVAAAAPSAAQANDRPWKGDWIGSGRNQAAGKGRFKVDFSVTRKKTLVDLELRNVYFHCDDQQATYGFDKVEFEKTTKIGRAHIPGLPDEPRSFFINERFDSGFGSAYNYEVTVWGEFNRDWTRVGKAEAYFEGPLIGNSCATGMDWSGHHA